MNVGFCVLVLRYFTLHKQTAEIRWGKYVFFFSENFMPFLPKSVRSCDKATYGKKITHNDNFVEDKLKENNSSLREKQQSYSGCHFNRQNHS